MSATVCSRRIVCFAAAAVVSSSASAQVSDGSFESPAIIPTSWVYNPGGSPWTFLGNSGITSPINIFSLQPAPAGNQVAFLQTDVTPSNFGSFSQTIFLPTTGPYTLSYLDAGRHQGGNFGGNVNYEVWLGSTLLANMATVSNQPFTPQSIPFAATTGFYLLEFRISASQLVGDNTALFDSVSVIPAPSSLAILAAAGGWLAVRRRPA